MNEIQTTSPARLLINGETITGDNIDKEIENVIAELRTTNDTAVVDNAITTMIGLSKISLFSLAHLLYEFNLWWLDTDQENIRGDTFEDYIESVHNLNPTVMGRYISIWHMRANGMFPDGIENRPIKDQQAIAKALEQGYEISDEQWDELRDAGNTNEVNKILREVKGKEPTKASYVGYLERSGDIVFWHQEQRVHVGFIKNPDDADNEFERKVLEKAQARAINGMGLIER
jgi:hypothetical protein